MSYRMYQPDRKSKVNFYVLIVSAMILGWSFYVYFQPLIVDSVCSEVSLNTTGLTDRYNLNPTNDYDFQKASCISDVLAAEK